MNNETVSIVIRFVLLLLAQVLICNNIDFLGYINPYVYILFVLYYPSKTNNSIFLIISFLLGLSIDVFSDSGGINAASLLVIAYSRPMISNYIFGLSQEYHALKISEISITERVTYIFIIALIHHFVLFLLEIFSINMIATILKKTLFSSIFTTILCSLIVSLFSSKKINA